MLAEAQSPQRVADRWLAGFERALGTSTGGAGLEGLFESDSHWRDVLALTWRIGTVSGAAPVAARLARHCARARPHAFEVDPQRTPPRRVKRGGRDCVEAIFRFETAEGRGSGVVRLLPGSDKAWTLLTALEDLNDKKKHLENEKPAVLIVGGGQAGLSIGARLKRSGIGALIVDRWPRVGDNWRRRYDALKLHNQVHVNHLPYLPFPASFPLYIPKDRLADWFESYAEAMGLDYWTSAEFQGAIYEDGRWRAKVRREGRMHELRPRHIVMATGVSDVPIVPDIPALKGFNGTVLHSSQYQGGGPWKDRRAVVIGTGTSGHDIAQDLHSAGAQVTIVQRSPTLVIQCDPSAQLVYGIYGEGPPLEDCDLVTAAVPLQVSIKAHQLACDHARQLDRALLDKLEEKGFRLDFGEDNSGWQFKYLRRGGGYYFNVGCSDLIVEGKVGLAQLAELEKHLKDADLAVLATGYKGLEATIEHLFGKPIADRVGPIWGIGDNQELRNMFQRTAQPGLWFIAGSFAQCRIYSKFLALQIQAMDAGLLA